jgi:hypothetical protein
VKYGEGLRLAVVLLAGLIVLAVGAYLVQDPTITGLSIGIQAGGDVSSCQNLSNAGIFTLTSDVSNTSTCFTIGADDVVLDCQGYTISFANQSAGENSAGVLAVSRKNVTVQNCRIQDANESDKGGVGINFTSTSNSFVLNNTVITNGTSNNYGISFFSGFYNNTIENNTVRTRGTQNANYGIVLVFTGAGNKIINNNVTTNGTNNNYGIWLGSAMNNNSIRNNTIYTGGNESSNYGIYLFLNMFENNVTDNNIVTNGTDTNDGIILQSTVFHTKISNNTVTAWGTAHNNRGIRLVTTNQGNHIIGNLIDTNGTSGNSGIVLTAGSPNNTVEDNTIMADGSSGVNFGIDIGTRVNNVTNNTIITNGNLSHGIRLQAGDNIFISNNITTKGNDSYAIRMDTSTFGNQFNHTVLSNPYAWLFSDSTVTANISNITFATGNGSIRYPNTFELNASFNITRKLLNITFNQTYLNSSNATVLNQTAIIILEGLTFTHPRAVADLDGDGTTTDCTTTTTPSCQELGYNSGSFEFNVSHFTTYATKELNISIDTCRGIEYPGDYSVIDNVPNTTTCMRFVTDNINLDCNGYTLSFANQSAGENSAGVLAIGRKNVTVQNCRIQDANESDKGGVGINFTSTSNSFILNNTVITNGTSNNYGISIFNNIYNNTIENNTVRTRGIQDSNWGVVLAFTGAGNKVRNNNVSTNGTNQNYGILLVSSMNNNSIWNNTIMTLGNESVNVGIYLNINIYENNISDNTVITNGSLVSVGTSNPAVLLQSTVYDTMVSNNSLSTQNGIGIHLLTTVHRTSVYGNSISTNGTSASEGIVVQGGSTNHSILSNTIVSDVSSGAASGIQLMLGDSNNVSNNTIITIGNLSHGIEIVTNFNFLSQNNITVNGNASYAIHLSGTSIGNQINNTIISDPTAWIFADSTATANISNITFANQFGRIQFQDTFELNGSFNITQKLLNISLNETFVNATNLTLFNRSAVISLYGINFTDPKVVVNVTSIGQFANCTATTDPACEEISFVNNIFVFNVSHFTRYASAETDNAPPVLSSATALSITQTSAVLDVATDEAATCRYDIADVAYADLAAVFESTGGVTSHSSSVIGLTAGTSYGYYVACADAQNNPSATQIISFTTTSASGGGGGGGGGSGGGGGGAAVQINKPKPDSKPVTNIPVPQTAPGTPTIDTKPEIPQETVGTLSVGISPPHLSRLLKPITKPANTNEVVQGMDVMAESIVTNLKPKQTSPPVKISVKSPTNEEITVDAVFTRLKDSGGRKSFVGTAVEETEGSFDVYVVMALPNENVEDSISFPAPNVRVSPRPSDLTIELNVQKPSDPTYAPSLKIQGLFEALYRGPVSVFFELFGPYKQGEETVKLAQQFSYGDVLDGEHLLQLDVVKGSELLATQEHKLNLIKKEGEVSNMVLLFGADIPIVELLFVAGIITLIILVEATVMLAMMLYQMKYLRALVEKVEGKKRKK